MARPGFEPLNSKMLFWEAGALAHYATEACVRIQSISSIYTRQKFMDFWKAVKAKRGRKGKNPYYGRLSEGQCTLWLQRHAEYRRILLVLTFQASQGKEFNWKSDITKFRKVISIFAQWVCGPQVVLYKWVWSKLPNIFMIFRPKMHDFGTYMTIVQFFSNLDIFLNYNIRQFFSNYKYLHQL